MTPETLVLTALGLFFASLSALISAVETAIVILDGDQRKRLGENSSTIAEIFASLREHPRRLENALLLTNTLSNLPLIVTCLLLLARLPMTTHFSEALSAFVVFGAIIFFCEIVPKMVALAYPLPIARVALPIAAQLSAVFAPVCILFQRFCEKIVGRIAPGKPTSPQDLTDEELQTLVALAHEEGNLHHDESEMIREIMQLAHQNVKHCMTPRVDIFSIKDDLTNDQVEQILRTRVHSRILVQGESPDDIVGILESRKFFLNRETHYSELVDPPSYVPETMNALELLRSFLSRKQAMAILVDEYGGIEGIVTLSDLVEEIMGNAAPAEETELYIERLGDGKVLVSGSARLDDLASVMGFEADGAGVDTIGGLVLNRLGHLPRQGMRLPFHGWEIVVRRTTRHRIKELLLERQERENASKEGGK